MWRKTNISYLLNISLWILDFNIYYIILDLTELSWRVSRLQESGSVSSPILLRSIILPLQFEAPGVGPNITFEVKNNLVKTVQQQDEERVDSPARMSLSAKREMFESVAGLTPEAEKPDPDMMSLSKRKALI